MARSFRFATVCVAVLTLAGALTASAGTSTPTAYVLQDSGKIIIIHGTHQSEISGHDTGLYSTVGIARQASGDLVVSNRELDSRPGNIVTLPPGKGDVHAKYKIKCKGLTPWGIGVDADSNIWMTDYESNDVREYAATANGCPEPLARISGIYTGLDQPENVAIDGNGRIVVSNYLNGIVIFSPGANGDAFPVAKITSPQVVSAHLEGMAIDAKNNIWVTSYANQAVIEFGPDANGNAAPKRMIAGSNTQMTAPVGIAIDRKTKEIYVADYGTRAVLVFAPDADGNVAPVRQIAPGFAFGIALK